MEVVKFAKDFSKLNSDEFQTIRMPNKKVKENDIVLIKSPKKEFKAKCTFRERLRLDHIFDEFLMKDTNTKSIEDAIEVLREFYPLLGWGSEVVILTFSKDIGKLRFGDCCHNCVKVKRTALSSTFYCEYHIPVFGWNICDYFEMDKLENLE